MRTLIPFMIFCIAVFASNVWALPVTDGLVLHLDADAVTDVADGAKIDIWEDLSGMGNNATQPVEANQPVYVAHNPDFFDQPVVRFDGGQFMELPSTMISVGSFTAFAVARFNATQVQDPNNLSTDLLNNQYIFAGQDGGGDDRIRVAWDNSQNPVAFEYRAGSSGWKQITSPADTLIHVFAVTSTVEGFLDGVSVGTADNTSNENPTAFNIGSYNRGQKDFFNGELAELVIYNRVLSTDEVAQVSEALRIKTSFPHNPKPADQAVDVNRNKPLKWTPGEGIQGHLVFLGTDINDVSEADEVDDRGVLVSEHTGPGIYEPPNPLDFNQSYFWKVIETNDDDPNGPWVGKVWSFTTANFVHVDDFEDYNDFEPYRIFDTWMDGWGVDENGAEVGYSDPDFDNDEHYIETTILHGGLQSMPYFYDKDLKYAEAVLPLEGSARDWTAGDVYELSLWLSGYIGNVGSFVEATAGTYTITGAGADIFGSSDEFHFAYKEISSGTATIIAKVENIDNTDPFAKAGVMIRDSLETDSRNSALLITPENGLRFQYRTTQGGDTDRQFDPNIVAPYWLKMQRSPGGLVRAYYSEDGSDWTQFTLQQVAMQMPVYVGLAVTSHNSGAACQATFSNVTVDGTLSQDQWAEQDIGIRSNSAQPMYVALNDMPVYYSGPNDPNVISPNATHINTWTEWKIPLEKFVDQGVDLTQVETMAIGIGIQGDTTTLGGTGLLFFDDIRLNRP